MGSTGIVQEPASSTGPSVDGNLPSSYIPSSGNGIKVMSTGNGIFLQRPGVLQSSCVTVIKSIERHSHDPPPDI